MGTIREGEWVLFKFSDGYMKMLSVKKQNKLSLGKIGTIQGSELIGKPSGFTYEIQNDNTIKVVSSVLVKEESEYSEPTANNKDLVDDNTSQSLTPDEIQKLKNSGASGEEIVQQLIQNSTSFSQKTEFSQAKYIRKKKQKYLKVFTVIKPTLRTLFEFNYTKYPARIFDMRIDAMSQLLAYANIRSHNKVIVVDGIHGLLTAAVAERVGENGFIINFHSTEGACEEPMRQLNLPQKTLDLVWHVPWSKLNLDFDAEKKKLQEIPQDTLTTFQLKRKLRQLDRIQEALSTLSTTKFDSLIVASEHDPEIILRNMLPLLAPSRQFSIFSQYLEPLSKCFIELKQSNTAINISLTESWYRPYQVLPGRTHPEMQMTSSSGYLLSGTTTAGADQNKDWFSEFLPEAKKIKIDTQEKSNVDMEIEKGKSKETE